MATWTEQLGAIQKLREQRRQASDELYSIRVNLLQARKDFRNNPSQETGQRINRLEEQRKRATAVVDASVTGLHEAIVGVYVDPHPRNVISNLNDNTPFLLLPVRIETRFMTTGAAPELWIRVYPDDIAIHSHERVLRENEITAGAAYWRAVFTAQLNGGDELQDRKKEAWDQLLSVAEPRRAAWIIRQTKPTNWNEAGIDSAGQLIFPSQELTATDAWTLAPRTNVLPDKFVVMLYQGENITREVTGQVIPDELFVGPDPMDAENAFINAPDDTLTFGPAFDWTADFSKAVAVGMGFKIPLTPAEAENGFDKIVVLGAYLSAAEGEAQQAIETLIDNHHYSSGGFGIVTQGTPTNNTEDDSTGFSESDPFNTVSFQVETGEPLFTGTTDCDGRNLADALGIAYDPLQFIVNSNATDHREAVAMNTALYPSTLGFYFDTMLKPVLDETDQAKLRSFFTRYVSGRGPLPAIRAGNQPYGVLLTSDFSKWKRTQNEFMWGNNFLDTFYKVLDHYHTIWKNLSGLLSFTGKPGSDPDETLMNILGLQPGSVSFLQRIAFSTDTLLNNAAFMEQERHVQAIRDSFTSKRTLLDFLTDLGYNPNQPDGKFTVPQQLRLVFQHSHTALPAANLIDNVPLSEKNGIRYYDDGLKKNYLHWLLENTSVASLEKQDFPEGKRPNALLYLQLRRSLLLELAKASVRWFKRGNIDLDLVMQPVNFHNIRPERGLTKWEAMKGKVGKLIPQDPHREKAIADHLLSTGSTETEAEFLNRMKEALATLADLPTARLERCFTEHIDLCTYRLDAWQTALFDQRLKKQRNLESPDGGERTKGIYLGAYGWVENVRPSPKRQVVRERIHEKLRPANEQPLYEYADNGGFVHAPSINHATAAAVLRSGYLSHASSDQPDLMAVNLSSERVRRALFVLQGITNGQTLEALLGYQFERGLHDRASANDDLKRLNEFIYKFRDKYLIEQHLIPQQGIGAVEAIPANNVVNGLTLAESGLDFPYGADIDLLPFPEPLRTALRDAVTGEKDKLEDTLDAVKDLLLSESVYQLVQGNFDRAAAVTNALRDVHIPPEIEVINTPKSSHLGFTNRVTIQFEQVLPGDPGANPWTPVPMTPRAAMETGVNKWLGKILGRPDRLACMVSHINADGVEESEELTLDALNIQPIDLVYIVGNEISTGNDNTSAASEIETRIAAVYRRGRSLSDDVTVSIKFTGPHAEGKKALGDILPMLRMLKSVLTESQPLHAQDFDPPSRSVPGEAGNMKGYVADELRDRVESAQALFVDLLRAFTSLPIIKTDGGVNMQLGAFFTELDASRKNVNETGFEFGREAELRDILAQISLFGLADSFPVINDLSPAGNITLLLEQARSIARRMSAIIQTTDDLMAEEASLSDAEKERKTAMLIAVGKAMFGEVFNVLPQFRYNSAEDVRRSDDDRSTLLRHASDNLSIDFPAEEWIHGISHVRPRVARWESVRALYELSNNDTLELLPVQLPYRPNDSWLAVEFPAVNADGSPFTVIDDTLSITIHGDAAFATAQPQSGLLIDDWTEVIPNSEEITGVAFHFNQPNAMAPQALLLAVTPEENGKWSWQDLVGIVNDTMLRAKLRAVEPWLLDRVDRPETGVLLPALMASFTSSDLDISLDYRRNIDILDQQLSATLSRT